MSVRIVHEGSWIYPGGSERLAKEMAQTLDAKVTVGHAGDPSFWDDVDAEIVFQDINKPPIKWLPKTVREMILALRFRQLEFPEKTVISSGSTAKWWAPRAEQRHIHYCHTSPPQLFTGGTSGVFDSFLKTQVAMMDRFYANMCDEIVSNSEFTAQRVRRHYGIESDVIHPPIATDQFHHDVPAEDAYFVMIGRINEMKRAGIVAAAFDDIDSKLVLVGDGPLREECEAYSGVRVTENLSPFALRELVARAVGGIALAEREHCGMTPKEFQAAGKPVIVPNEPNLKNHVSSPISGVRVDPTITGVRNGVEAVKSRTWDRESIQATAEEWSTGRFRRKLTQLVEGEPPQEVEV